MSGSPIRDYVYQNGEPTAMKVYGSTDAWYYFLNDHLGTPQKMVDSAGAVARSAGYMPFGEAQQQCALDTLSSPLAIMQCQGV